MTSFNSQLSRAVMTFVVLQQGYVTTRAIQDLAHDELETLSTAFQKINEYFDPYNAAVDINPPFDNNPTEINTGTQIRIRRGSKNNSSDFEIKHIQQRSQAGSPSWQCSTQVNWKDLGNLHYPRFVKEILCSGDSCMLGFKACRSQYYPFNILTSREHGDRLELSLPRSLRRDWKFIDVPISVGCMCGN